MRPAGGGQLCLARTTALALLALLTFSLLGLVACSQAPEQALLQRYFNAARMRDNTTLQNIATVQFSPTEDGSFSSVKGVSEMPEQSRPLKLKELAKAERDAQAAEEEFNKKKKEYQDTNLEAIDRVLKAERTNAKLKGPDLKVQEEWVEWREDTKQYDGFSLRQM